jgi:hypothetical protein
MKEDEMGGACNNAFRKDKLIQHFGREQKKEQPCWRYMCQCEDNIEIELN